MDNRNIILIFVSTNNQLKIHTMKKLNFIISLISLVGQLIGFVGIFIADSHNQLMLSLWTFLGFACIGGLSLIFSGEKNKKISDNIL